MEPVKQKAFRSRFSTGECAVCGTTFAEGDLIAFYASLGVRRRYRHAGCWADQIPPRAHARRTTPDADAS